MYIIIHTMGLDKEAEFLNVLVLASLFYNTLKAFDNIHSSLNDFKDEKVYLAQLGIEQARLLIWGEQMGIFSLPPSLTFLETEENRETMTPRDPRLDDDEVRVNLEGLMNSIIHTLSNPNDNDSDLDTTGLRPLPRGGAQALEQPAADLTRMKNFEQSYAHLLDVGSNKVSVKRPSKLSAMQWVIHDTLRFSNFVKSTKRQVDTLLMALNINDKVEDILLGDIRDLGKHASGPNSKPSPAAVKDMAKLKLLIRATKGRYPALLNEAQNTFNNLQKGVSQEHDMAAKVHKLLEPVHPDSAVASAANSGTATPEKRPGFIRRLSTQTWNKLPGRKTPSSSRPASPERRKSLGRRTPGSSKPVTPAVSRPASPVLE
ncbi:hypothetical protein D6C90_00951 [Aureobasidium pullulans]|uniref:Prion-inhibition and propagation HeLo domain-containing protein n=1 Tax=Aureobasidium pullulans TaxID=5580 RepID=A0A4S8ZPH7_AURPU|nr:hypothetical protein D6D28_00505 [Aureobasidium pullulans]THW67973.1 hypothetical protein D6D20_00198 [Aureobasidium pullulans]THZ52739.1 hypothetical protein D6C90_00951 [Aureobasidium pullulans]